MQKAPAALPPRLLSRPFWPIRLLRRLTTLFRLESRLDRLPPLLLPPPPEQPPNP